MKPRLLRPHIPRGRGGNTTSGAVEALALAKKLVRGATPTRGVSLSEESRDVSDSSVPSSSELACAADWVGFGNRAIGCGTTGGGGLPLFEAKNEPIERVAAVLGGGAATGVDNDDEETEALSSLSDAAAAIVGASPPRSALEARPIMAKALVLLAGAAGGGATDSGSGPVGASSRTRFLAPVGDSVSSESLGSIALRCLLLPVTVAVMWTVEHGRTPSGRFGGIVFRFPESPAVSRADRIKSPPTFKITLFTPIPAMLSRQFASCMQLCRTFATAVPTVGTAKDKLRKAAERAAALKQKASAVLVAAKEKAAEKKTRDRERKALQNLKLKEQLYEKQDIVFRNQAFCSIFTFALCSSLFGHCLALQRRAQGRRGCQAQAAHALAQLDDCIHSGMLLCARALELVVCLFFRVPSRLDSIICARHPLHHQANYNTVKASLPPAEAAVGTNVFKAVVAKYKSMSESEKKVQHCFYFCRMAVVCCAVS